MFNDAQSMLMNPLQAIANVAGSPGSMQPADPDQQGAAWNTMGQVGALLMAAGQRMTPQQRAQILAGIAPAIGNMPTHALNAAQALLMQTKALEAQQEQQRQAAVQGKLSDPAFAKSLGNFTPEQLQFLGPQGAMDVMKARASHDPWTREYQERMLKIAETKQDPNYEMNVRTQQADQLGLTGDKRTLFIANGKVPEKENGNAQLVDLPGGGKGWSVPGSDQVVPIGGAGKGGSDPEMAKRSEAEDKNLTYAKEAIAATKVLSNPTYYQELTNGVNKRLNVIPTINGSWAGDKYLTGDAQANSFVDSVVRPRSGAVVGPTELADKKRIFTPMPGDTPEQLMSKAAQRAEHIQSLIAGSNPADRPMLQKMYQDTVAELQKMYSAGDAGGEQPAAPSIPGVKAIRQIN